MSHFIFKAARGFLVVCAVLSLWVRPAVAQDAAQSSARAHYAAGKSAVAGARYEDAYREFERGHKLSLKPEFLFNMGECARMLGSVATARANYEAYLRDAPTGHLRKVAESRLAGLGPSRPASPSSSTSAPKANVAAGIPYTPELPGPREVSSTNTVFSQPKVVDDGGSILARWPFWAAVGAIVVTGGVVAIALSQGGDESPSLCAGSCATADFR
jgi:hypothetical protein